MSGEETSSVSATSGHCVLSPGSDPDTLDLGGQVSKHKKIFCMNCEEIFANYWVVRVWRSCTAPRRS